MPRNGVRRSWWMALTLVVVVVVASGLVWASGRESSGETTEGTTAGTSSDSSNDAREPGKAASDQRVELLTIGFTGQFPTLDQTQADHASTEIGNLAMEQLFVVGPDGRL